MANERATKKQQELLEYIREFLHEHNYAPSYREVMVALNYKSVSTVAVHIDGLIRKGILVKKDHSARSIRFASELVQESEHILWLREELAAREAAGKEDEVKVLQKALKILSDIIEE